MEERSITEFFDEESTATTIDLSSSSFSNSTLESCTKKTKQETSKVWDYFKKKTDENRVYCLYCIENGSNLSFSIKTSATILKEHLWKKHDVVIDIGTCLS